MNTRDRGIPAPKGTGDRPAPLTKAVPPAPTGRFFVEKDSPFPDGYSIALEEEKVGHLDLLSDDELNKHPDLLRWEELQDRKQRLQKMQDDSKGHHGADTRVPYRDTQMLNRMGRLVTRIDGDDGESDTMVLHTRHAFRLFVGRRRDPVKGTRPIPSAKRIGTVLKMLHDLSRFDNPYADWALLRADEFITRINGAIAASTAEFNKRLNDLEERGLKYRVLRSSAPQTFNLEFRSSYGYMLSEMIVQYDYFVRLVMTMVNKGQMADSELRTTLRPIIGSTRSFFEEMIRYEKVLCGPELRALSRSDYLPNANADAKKRVDAVSQIFGMVPSQIFKGEVLPQHTKRRLDATPQELDMLAKIYEDHALAAAEEDEGETKGEGQSAEQVASEGDLL